MVAAERYNLVLDKATVVPKYSRLTELFWNAVLVALIAYIVFCS